jgi:hypothetical protein
VAKCPPKDKIQKPFLKERNFAEFNIFVNLTFLGPFVTKVYSLFKKLA